MSCQITGWGAALPERVVTNAELAPVLGVTPEWIEANCGVRERRWAAPDQSASALAAAAASEALRDAGVGAAEVDYLIAGTLSPDYQVPGIAPLIQRQLPGCRPVPAVDLRVGCAAILYSLQLACGLIESGAAQTVLCCGAEAQSKGLELAPGSAELSMLFGDGAGAVVVRRGPVAGPSLIIEDILIASDGGFAEELIVRSPGTANGERWLAEEHLVARRHHASMQGRAVILHAVRKLTDAAIEVTARHGLRPESLDLVVPHQANLNLIRALGNRLGLDGARIVTNLERYGNTSGASAFLALWQAQREGRLRPGSRVLILAFGAGFTWGAALCRAAVVD